MHHKYALEFERKFRFISSGNRLLCAQHVWKHKTCIAYTRQYIVWAYDYYDRCFKSHKSYITMFSVLWTSFALFRRRIDVNFHVCNVVVFRNRLHIFGYKTELDWKNMIFILLLVYNNVLNTLYIIDDYYVIFAHIIGVISVCRFRILPRQWTCGWKANFPSSHHWGKKKYYSIEIVIDA